MCVHDLPAGQGEWRPQSASAAATTTGARGDHEAGLAGAAADSTADQQQTAVAIVTV